MEKDIPSDEKESLTIRQRYNRIQEAHRSKMKELLAEYNENVYYPALRELREECAAAGNHKPGEGRYWNNGMGSEWWHCSQCGGDHSANSYWDSTEDNENSDN